MFPAILSMLLLLPLSAFAQNMNCNTSVQIETALEGDPIGQVPLTKNTSLFGRPGIDSWETSKGASVAWPKKGTVLKVYCAKREGGKMYFLVSYDGDRKKSVPKWIASSHESIGQIQFTNASSASATAPAVRTAPSVVKSPTNEIVATPPKVENTTSAPGIRSIPEDKIESRPLAPVTIPPKVVKEAPAVTRTSPPSARVAPPAPPSSRVAPAAVVPKRNVILPNDDDTLRNYVDNLSQVPLTPIYTMEQVAARMPAGYDKYDEIIKDTSEHFGVNEQFLTCLIHQESKFETRATSNTGVTGIVQMVGNSRVTIGNIISTDIGRDERKRLQDLLNNPSQRPSYRSRAEWAGDLNYAQQAVDNYALRELWRGYYEKKGEVPPTSINGTAKRAIPAAALYVRMMVDIILRNLPDQRWGDPDAISEEDVFDFHMVLAAGYNAGEDKVIDIITSVKPPDPKVWRKRAESLKANGETKVHMEQIASCMGRDISNGTPARVTPSRPRAKRGKR